MALRLLDSSGELSETELLMAADAQTSGGLLLAVPEEKLETLSSPSGSGGGFFREIGSFTAETGRVRLVK